MSVDELLRRLPNVPEGERAKERRHAEMLTSEERTACAVLQVEPSRYVAAKREGNRG